MANCNKLFLDFNTTIALESGDKNDLRRSRNAVREKIRKYFKDKQNGFSPKFHGQGSFMMNTIIEPLDGEFDIDDGIYFKVKKEPSQSVSTFHRWIYEAIDGHTKEKPIDKQTCVRLIYAKHYHLDLPIYYIIEGQTPYLAHKSKGWIESDPREFIQWFNSKADEKGQLKRIVRYLKAWSDYRKGDLPSGLIFSILAANNIVFDERDDIAFHKTLCNIQRKLEQNFTCERPTTPVGENLLEEYSKTNKDYFLQRLDCFIKSAEKALDKNTNQKDASKIWQRHFGQDRFPLGLSEYFTITHYSESLVNFNCSKNKTSQLKYRDTEEFINEYFRVDIKYNLKIDCKVSQKGFRTLFLSEMIARKFPLLRGKTLEFSIVKCNVPQPFLVKWKVCNIGKEAIKRDMIRGEIVTDNGHHKKIESSDFQGEHFVECYSNPK